MAGQIELTAVDECLLSGVAANIIEERLTEEVLKHRLRILLEHGRFTPPEDDPWAEEWGAVLARLEGD